MSKTEILKKLITCAEISKKLEAMTDDQLADVIDETVLPNVPTLNTMYSIWDSVLLRLRRAKGGPMPCLDERIE